MSRTVFHALVGLCLFACAADPYLAASVACVNAATTRAQADACRAKLQDAALVKDAVHE